MSVSDLAAYRAVDRTPVRFPLGDLTVCSAGLPAMGGVAVGQILGIAARLGLTRIGRDLSAADIHVLAQSGRAGFAQRRLYGDPDFVPLDAAALLEPAYLDECARRATWTACGGLLAIGEQDVADSMTSHICVADAAGMVVSMTTTINQNFGARISVSGFYLNNVLTNFANERKSHGLHVANAMAPRKRPRTTIAPCIMLDPCGRAVGAIGAGGGHRIIGYVTNGLLRLAAGERDPQALVAAPHALNWGGLTELEPPLGRHVAALAARGHRTLTRPMDGGMQCLLLDATGVSAGGDIRRDGTAMATGA
jgi:gamma-glutamyltranspeptidase/glutathione hydrolase